MSRSNYGEACRRLRQIQTLWGRYEWNQVIVSLARYRDQLQTALCVVCEDPVAAAWRLAACVTILEEGREEINLNQIGATKLSPTRSYFLLRETVRGGEDGEVLRGVMYLLDESRPRNGMVGAFNQGHVGEGILQDWRAPIRAAMVAYQKNRGDVFPLTEEDWLIRQKVALHRAELEVDVWEGHTTGYLITRQSLMEARSLLLEHGTLGRISRQSRRNVSFIPNCGTLRKWSKYSFSEAPPL